MRSKTANPQHCDVTVYTYSRYVYRFASCHSSRCAMWLRWPELSCPSLLTVLTSSSPQPHRPPSPEVFSRDPRPRRRRLFGLWNAQQFLAEQHEPRVRLFVSSNGSVPIACCIAGTRRVHCPIFCVKMAALAVPQNATDGAACRQLDGTHGANWWTTAKILDTWSREKFPMCSGLHGRNVSPPSPPPF